MHQERVTGMLKEMIPLEEVIRILGLKPLTGEGGMWSQPYASDETVPGGAFEGRPTDRPLCSTIYYLITPNTFSCMHRLVTDEIWYHHAGPAARMLLIYPDGHSEVKLLGSDLLNGRRPKSSRRPGIYLDSCERQSSGKFSKNQRGAPASIASQAVRISWNVVSKSPVYQGSATSRLRPV